MRNFTTATARFYFCLGLPVLAGGIVLAASQVGAESLIRHVTNTEELQAALRQATSNREADIIFVDYGTYDLDTELRYEINDEERAYDLFIGGLPWQKPTLTGESAILGIDLNEQPGHGEVGNITIADLNCMGCTLDVSARTSTLRVINTSFHSRRGSGDLISLSSSAGRVDFVNNIVQHNALRANVTGATIDIDALVANVINNTITHNSGTPGGIYLRARVRTEDIGRYRARVFNNIIADNSGQLSYDIDDGTENFAFHFRHDAPPQSDPWEVYVDAARQCPRFYFSNNAATGRSFRAQVPVWWAATWREANGSPLFEHTGFGRAVIYRMWCPDTVIIQGNIAPCDMDGFELAPGSGCIDAGISTIDGESTASTDNLGRSRTIDGDGSGEAEPDIGAAEFEGQSKSLRRHRVFFLPARPKAGIPKDLEYIALPVGEVIKNSDDEVGWNLSLHRTASAGSHYSVYYGNNSKRNYDTGPAANKGRITIPDIVVDSRFGDALAFSLYMDVGPDRKRDRLRVLADEEVIWQSDKAGVPKGGWQRHLVDISRFRGKTVDFAFEFATGDGKNNANEGVYIDQVAFVGFEKDKKREWIEIRTRE